MCTFFLGFVVVNSSFNRQSVYDSSPVHISRGGPGRYRSPAQTLRLVTAIAASVVIVSAQVM
jgi:hypothetical protein